VVQHLLAPSKQSFSSTIADIEIKISGMDPTTQQVDGLIRISFSAPHLSRRDRQLSATLAKTSGKDMFYKTEHESHLLDHVTTSNEKNVHVVGILADAEAIAFEPTPLEIDLDPIPLEVESDLDPISLNFIMLPGPPVCEERKRKAPEHAFETNRKRKTVQFSNSTHSVREIPTIAPEDATNIWYNKRDLETIRTKVRGIAAVIHRRENVPHALPYMETIQNAYRLCFKTSRPTRHDMQGLFTWVSKGHSRRGLERWSVPAMRFHARNTHSTIVYQVTAAQQASYPGESNVERMERIRKASEFYSSAAKTFAEALGKADEEAAKEVHYDRPDIPVIIEGFSVPAHHMGSN
jgi:hypothetical protein